MQFHLNFEIFCLLVFGILNLVNSQTSLLEVVRLEENIKIGSKILDLNQVLTQKADLKISDSMKIYASQEDNFLPFRLEDGKISLMKPLDREAICEMNLQEEEDSCEPGACCQILHFNVVLDPTQYHKSYFIRVVVLDVNDNMPQFPVIEKPYKELREDVQVGTRIDLPIALDADSEAHGVKEYRIIQWLVGNRSHFNLDIDNIPKNSSRQGYLIHELRPYLIVVHSLDRELDDYYGFILEAIDDSTDNLILGNQRSATVNIFIKITDINDNKPEFNKQKYEVSVKENDNPHRILDFTIEDADFGQNSRLQLQLVDPTGLALRLFSGIIQPNNQPRSISHSETIHSNYPPNKHHGYLQLMDRLDAERLPPTIRFQLQASDLGSPQLSSTADVEVKILNINDQIPIISFFNEGKKLVRNRLELPENETPVNAIIAHINVEDEDSPVDNISCRLIGEDQTMFLLEMINGPLESSRASYAMRYREYVLRTTYPIDRESKAIYSVRVKCVDGDDVQPLSSESVLNVIVTDKNDNPPLFERDLYIGHVYENEVHAEIRWDPSTRAPRALDKDLGQNAKISYSLVDLPQISSEAITYRGESEFFKLEGANIFSSSVPLDAELKNEFRLLLIATDFGDSVKLSSNTTLKILVDDVNDNLPFFRQSHYMFNIKENCKSGILVDKVEAFDNDIDLVNQRVVYKLRARPEDQGLIEINRSSGELRVRGRIDHEKKTQISLIVVAENEVPLRLNGVESSHDIGNPSETNVLITILNENDNRPEFIPLENMQRTHLTFVWERLAILEDTSINSQSNSTNQTETKPRPTRYSICEQIPYRVIDRDNLPSDNIDCCHVSLVNDYNGIFALMPSTSNFLCVVKKPQEPKSYKITLEASDGQGPDALVSQLHITVIIKSNPLDLNSNQNYPNLDEKNNGNQESSRMRRLFDMGIMRNSTAIAIMVIIAIVFCTLLICIICAFKKCSVEQTKGPLTILKTTNTQMNGLKITPNLSGSAESGTMLRVDHGNRDVLVENLRSNSASLMSDELMYQRLNNFSISNRTPLQQTYYPILKDKTGSILLHNNGVARGILSPQTTPKFANFTTMSNTQKAQILAMNSGISRPILSAVDFGLKSDQSNETVSRSGSIYKNRLNNDCYSQGNRYQTINPNSYNRSASRQKSSPNKSTPSCCDDEESISNPGTDFGTQDGITRISYYNQEMIGQNLRTDSSADSQNVNSTSQQITNYFQTSFV